MLLGIQTENSCFMDWFQFVADTRRLRRFDRRGEARVGRQSSYLGSGAKHNLPVRLNLKA